MPITTSVISLVTYGNSHKSRRTDSAKFQNAIRRLKLNPYEPMLSYIDDFTHMNARLESQGVSNMEKPKAVDLFAGAGGLTEGLRQAGFNVIGAVEIDRNAAESYRLNHPRCIMLNKDITLVEAEEVTRSWGLSYGELDLLAGCPPCQGFSTIGTRNGEIKKDPRNDLLFQFEKFVDQLYPKTIMIENVPALAFDTRMTQFREHLGKKGYYTDLKVLDVARYGVPQHRKRMILFASRIGAVKVHDVNLNSDGERTVAAAFSALSECDLSGDPLSNYCENRSQRIRKLIANIPKDGGSRCDLPEEYILDCHKKTSGFSDVYGRMRWNAPSPTITGGCISPSKGRFLHPEENRAITLREAASLQTLPFCYRFSNHCSRQSIATMIGNALPPTFIKFHARCLATFLRR